MPAKEAPGASAPDLSDLDRPPVDEAAGVALLKRVDDAIESAEGAARLALVEAKGRYLLRFPFLDRGYAFELAIECFKTGIAMRADQPPSIGLGDAWSNLGIAFYRRQFGKRRKNIERAIHACRRALRLFRSLGDEEAAAHALVNLGAAYSERIEGARAANLEIALACYAHAERRIDRETTPAYWAKIELNRGNLLRNRSAGVRAENLDRAIGHLEAAKAVLEQGPPTADLARCLINLGAALGERGKRGAPDDLARAVAVLETGRRRFPESERPHEAARFAHNLGCAFCDLGQTGRARATDRGIIHLRRAVCIRNAAKDHRMAAQSLDALGTAWLERRRGDRARNLAAAIEAHEDALEARLRMNLPDEAARSAHNLALALCERGHGDDWDRVALVARRMVFDNEARFQGTRYGEEHRRLVGDIGGLKDMGALALLNAGDPAAAEAFARQGRARLLRLWTGERTIEGTTAETGDLTLTMATPPGEQGSFAFVSDRRATVTPVFLPALSRDRIDGLLAGDQGWFAALAALRREDHRSFEACLDRVRRALREGLAPLIAAFEGVTDKPLRLAASGALAILPIGDLLAEAVDAPVIHATGAGDGAQANTGSCRTVLIVADAEADRPLPHGRREAEWIADLLPDARPALIGPDATRAAVLDALQGETSFDILHLSCHARFDWREPDRSGLSLADGEALTFADIRAFKGLRAPPLVVLSACETGATAFRDLPDEAYGLPLAFLAAGASGVVSALWPVADRSTALLMRRFYELHLGGAHPAAALRDAQLWLRDATAEELADYVAGLDDRDAVRGFGFANLGNAKGAPPSRRPFEHPWHWAGFIYSEA